MCVCVCVCVCMFVCAYINVYAPHHTSLQQSEWCLAEYNIYIYICIYVYIVVYN